MRLDEIIILDTILDTRYNVFMEDKCQRCSSSTRKPRRGLCAKCYFQEHNQRPEVRARKAAWARANYIKNHPLRRLTFEKRRALAMKRDGYKCTMCGSTKRLHVHHVDGIGYPARGRKLDNRLLNLRTLCSTCHVRAHHESPPDFSRVIRKGKISLGAFLSEAERRAGQTIPPVIKT